MTGFPQNLLPEGIGPSWPDLIRGPLAHGLVPWASTSDGSRWFADARVEPGHDGFSIGLETRPTTTAPRLCRAPTHG